MKFKFRKRDYGYLDNYKINENGEYEYEGIRFAWNPKEVRPGKMRRMWAMVILTVILQILSGCVPAPGVNSQPYIIIPFFIGIWASVLGGLSLWKASDHGDEIPDYVFKKSIDRIPATCLVVFICVVVAVLGDVFYIITHMPTGIIYSVLFILMQIAAFLATMNLRKILMGIEWERLG